jgi:hypothetical protein
MFSSVLPQRFTARKREKGKKKKEKIPLRKKTHIDHEANNTKGSRGQKSRLGVQKTLEKDATLFVGFLWTLHIFKK